MQLGGGDGELADHAQHRGGDQTGPVGVEQPVQHPPDPVVVQRSGLTRGEAEHGRGVPLRPLGQGIDRSMPDHDVADHHGDHRRRGQPQPSIVMRQVALQLLTDPHPGQEVVHNRQATQLLTLQPERLR